MRKSLKRLAFMLLAALALLLCDKNARVYAQTHVAAMLDLANAFTGANTFAGTTGLNGGGALAGTFSGSPTFSDNPTFSGTPVFSNGASLTGNFSGNQAFTGTPAFGTASYSGSITSTASGATSALNNSGATTAQRSILFGNTGGQLFVGVDNNTGGAFTGTPYASAWYSTGNDSYFITPN